MSLGNPKYGEAQLQQGPQRSDALTFDFESGCCGGEGGGDAADVYRLELTVPDGATRFVSQAGFTKGEESGNTAGVAFYRNEYREGRPLRQLRLSSASEVAPLDLAVKGASKIIVLFECLNPGRRWRRIADDDPTFGFVDARFE